MQVMIIDATGSISDERLAAAHQYGCSILGGGKVDTLNEVVCSIYWTGIDTRAGYSLHLERFVQAFKILDPNCVVHFITDGLVIEDEIKGIDYIHVHEEFIPIIPEYVKPLITSVVPRAYMMEVSDA